MQSVESVLCFFLCMNGGLYELVVIDQCLSYWCRVPKCDCADIPSPKKTEVAHPKIETATSEKRR